MPCQIHMHEGCSSWETGLLQQALLCGFAWGMSLCGVVAYVVPVSLRRLLMVRPSTAAWMQSPLNKLFWPVAGFLSMHTALIAMKLEHDVFLPRRAVGGV